MERFRGSRIVKLEELPDIEGSGNNIKPFAFWKNDLYIKINSIFEIKFIVNFVFLLKLTLHQRLRCPYFRH